MILSQPTKQLVLIIDLEGNFRFIHDDELSGLFEEGEVTIQRASDVEPEGTDWWADLARVNGPRLGPFAKRQEALNAEVAWLNEHHLV